MPHASVLEREKGEVNWCAWDGLFVVFFQYMKGRRYSSRVRLALFWVNYGSAECQNFFSSAAPDVYFV